MPDPRSALPPGMLLFSRAALLALRRGLLGSDDGEGSLTLQEAGYAGGPAIYDAFQRWLAERTVHPPGELELEEFTVCLSAFFEECGWGSLKISSMDGVVAAIDCIDWVESEPEAGAEVPGCHITTGLFADLFGRIAGAAVAVLEVECRSAGQLHCRFLVGSPEVMDAIYEDMVRGIPYEQALAAA
jgi:predicted hydrocarbon binding protein